MNRPVIILGGGGHARSLADTLLAMQQSLLGFVDPQALDPLLADIPYLGVDDEVFQYPPDQVLLVNGIGSTGSTIQRQQLFDTFCSQGYEFADVRHPSAVLSNNGVILGKGSQVLAGALLGPGVRLENNVLINTRAVIEHNCEIGCHSHVATGAILCGDCQIGERVHIGAGAVINQGITIGDGVIIASGSVVIENIDRDVLVAGVPAQVKRVIQKQDV